MPQAKVEVALFDLADLQSVRDWANRALDFGFPLDVLVNKWVQMVAAHYLLVGCMTWGCGSQSVGRLQVANSPPSAGHVQP